MDNYKECHECNKIIRNYEYHDCDVDPFGDLSLGLLNPQLGMPASSALMLDLYPTDYTLFGLDKTKIIEKLEQDIDSANAATRSAHKRNTKLENTNNALEKKNAGLEKKNRKESKKLKNAEIELKISKDVIRNLMNLLKKS